jgi:hypothetical protein
MLICQACDRYSLFPLFREKEGRTNRRHMQMAAIAQNWMDKALRGEETELSAPRLSGDDQAGAGAMYPLRISPSLTDSFFKGSSTREPAKSTTPVQRCSSSRRPASSAHSVSQDRTLASVAMMLEICFRTV